MISVQGGSSQLLSNTSGAPYLNLSSLSTSDDFTNYSASYQLFSLTKLHVLVTRVANDTEVANASPNFVANVYFAYQPTAVSSTTYDPTTNESALCFPPYYNRSIKKTWTIPDITSTRTVLGVDYAVNLRNKCPIDFLACCTGQIAFKGITAAVPTTTSTNLYQLQIMAEVIFYAPN